MGRLLAAGAIGFFVGRYVRQRTKALDPYSRPGENTALAIGTGVAAGGAAFWAIGVLGTGR